MVVEDMTVADLVATWEPTAEEVIELGRTEGYIALVAAIVGNDAVAELAS